MPRGNMTWFDDETDAVGYFVLHGTKNMKDVLCTGGTRMRKGCTIDEVGDLAGGMYRKSAVYNLGVSGAKAGIDFDSRDPRAPEVLERFMEFMEPWLDKRWVTAEDLGLSQQDVNLAFEKLGLGHSYHAAIQRGEIPEETSKRVDFGMTDETTDKEGHKYQVGDIAGGYGVAQACLGVIAAMGWNLQSTTVAIQGVGTMGGGAAWYLHQAGVKVIGLADVEGMIYDQGGLDVPEILANRTASMEIDRTKLKPSVTQHKGPDVLTTVCDILVPAAVSYAIDDNVATNIVTSVGATKENTTKTKVVVEAANNPIVETADEILRNNGVMVVPDFIANAGAVIHAWYLLQGIIGTDPEADLRTIGSPIFDKAKRLTKDFDKYGVPPRYAAEKWAEENAASNGQSIIIP